MAPRGSPGACNGGKMRAWLMLLQGDTMRQPGPPVGLEGQGRGMCPRRRLARLAASYCHLTACCS